MLHNRFWEVLGYFLGNKYKGIRIKGLKILAFLIFDDKKNRKKEAQTVPSTLYPIPYSLYLVPCFREVFMIIFLQELGVNQTFSA